MKLALCYCLFPYALTLAFVVGFMAYQPPVDGMIYRPRGGWITR